MSKKSAPKVASKSKAKQPRARKAVDAQIEIVEKYVAMIKPALGQEGPFQAAITALQSDSKVRAVELAAIANAIHGSTPVRTPRQEALRRIRSQHAARLDLSAKRRAQAGKSAA